MRLQPVYFILFLLAFMTVKSGLAGEAAQKPTLQIFHARLVATIGLDREFFIEPLKKDDEKSILPIRVNTECSKALALATILSKEYECLDGTLQIILTDTLNKKVRPKPFPKDISGIKTLFRTALRDNPLFADIEEGNEQWDFFIKFTKDVVQYSRPDSADLYSTETEVAAVAFAQVLGLKDIRSAAIFATTEVSPPCLYAKPLTYIPLNSPKALPSKGRDCCFPSWMFWCVNNPRGYIEN